MAKIDDLIRIIRPMLPSTTNNLQHLKRSRNIVGDGTGKYNDPLWSIGKTDKRPQNVNVLSQAEIDELNRANRARYNREYRAKRKAELLLEEQQLQAENTPVVSQWGDDGGYGPYREPRGYDPYTENITDGYDINGTREWSLLDE